MKKDRILSLILSVMMMFTIIFPAGVFAEEIETQEYEPEVEEVVVEIGNDEVPRQGTEQDDEPAAETEVAVEEEVVASETVVEESVTEEAALAAVEEDERPFVQGYVRVNGGVTVYAAESKQEEKGSFSGDAIVYATVSTRASEEAYTWLRIVFDTAEAKEANEALLSGYVQFKDVNVLSDEAVEQLIESLKNDSTVRSYGEKLLPVVSFALKIFDEIDVVEVEAVIADEIVKVESAEAGSHSWTEAPTLTAEQTAEGVVTLTWTVEAEEEGEIYSIYELVDGSEKVRIHLTDNSKTATLRNVADGEHSYVVYGRIYTGGSWKWSTVSNTATVTVDSAIVVNGVTYRKLTDTTLIVISYEGSERSVSIPEVINGMTVTQIGEGAFERNTTIESIDLPNTITTIGKRAFKGCTALKEMKTH